MPDPYVKQTWVDGVAGGTPISAARLSYIEDGIENATVEDGAYASNTPAVATTYVDAVSGDDATGTGAVGAPYKTIQKAWDSLPSIVVAQQTIQLLPGVYNENATVATRPSILFADKKYTGTRTDRPAGVMTGPVVIKGSDGDPTACIIETNSVHIYGVYCVQGQLALQNLTIRQGSATNAAGLLVAHRNTTYVHASDIVINGNSATSIGAYAESGGRLEINGASIVENCTLGLQSYAESSVDITNTSVVRDCTTGFGVSGGFGRVFGTAQCLSPVTVDDGGFFHLRGTSGAARATCGSTVTIRNGRGRFIFGTCSALVEAIASTVESSSTNFNAGTKATGSTWMYKGGDVVTNSAGHGSLNVGSTVIVESASTFVGNATANWGALVLEVGSGAQLTGVCSFTAAFAIRLTTLSILKTPAASVTGTWTTKYNITANALDQAHHAYIQEF